VLYKDSDLSLITYGGENSYSTPSPGTEEWKTLDITDASIVSGTNYDIGVWVNSTSGGNACRYRYDTDASYSLKSDTYTYHATNAPVDPAVIDATLSSRHMSLYGTYTASSPATTSVDTLQKLIYTYDANGNITGITDNSKTGTGKIANFAYDPLKRLTSASTSVATSTSYTHSYTYSSIGNISSSTPTGSYSYAGTSYANPHAATSIGGVTHTYDNNGNLTNDGTWTHTWNYRNNLTQSGNGTVTSTFGYDHVGERVLKTEGGVTTAFPNRFYNTNGATSTKHIFAHDAPIATITSGGSSGIGFNATSTIIHGGFTSGPTTKNWTHTTSGSNRLLVLFADIWQDVGGTGTVTSATYNGTSLTKATSTRAGGMASEIWYLANPASGSNTLSVTVTGATDSIKLTAASFTGAAQSSPLDASNIATGFGGNPSASVTTVTANDLVTATLSRFGTTDATTNRTSLYSSTASSTLGAASYQIATTPTSYSDTYTGSADSDWSMVMAAFKPATGGTGSTTMYMIHSDHLTGTNVVTDANGDVVEVADYYPYGTERISSGSFEEQRKFADTEYDGGTGLNYMGARYYAGGKARFLSEDPAFLSVGSPELKQKTGLELQKYLENLQTHNSYSYTANNPLKYIDKEGEWLDTVVDIVAIAYSGYKLGQAIVNGGDVKGEAGNLALDVGGVFIPGVAGLGTLRRIEKAADVAGDAGKVGAKSLNTQRDNLLKNVENKKLENIIKDLYREKAKVGSGSTADAIRHELQTGDLVGGRSHIQKGQDALRGVEKLLGQGLSAGDKQKAGFLANDLRDALSKAKKQ
jgi:RHS repeat-associated protein